MKGMEPQFDAQFIADAKELFDIFIAGGYVEDGDEPLLDRLHAHFERLGNGS